MSFVRSVFTVSGYTVLSRLAGFVRELLTASFLGAGAVTDALSLAIRLPSFFRRLFAEGALNACFVPIFSGLYAQGQEKEAQTFAEHVLTLVLLVLLTLVIIVELFLPNILPVLLPGFVKTPERMAYLIQFTRLTFPFILFISLTALYGGVLNSLERFVAVASSPMMGNLFIAAFVLGMNTALSKPGYVFAMGVGLSGLIQLVWVMVPAWRRGIGLRLVMPKWTPHVRQFLLKMGPAAMGSGIAHINLFVGTFIASWLPVGSIAYLGFADRLNQLPLSVLGIALTTVLLPLLSKQVRAGQRLQADQTQAMAMEFGLFFSLPAFAMLWVLAEPLVAAVFERGAFQTKDTLQTAYTLRAYAIGVPAYVIAKIFSVRFFAQGDTRTPLLAGLGSVMTDVALSLFLMGTWHHVGIAIAVSAAVWVDALLLGLMLQRRGLLGSMLQISPFLGRLALACSITMAFLYVGQQVLPTLPLAMAWEKSFCTFGLLALGVLCFLKITSWLHIPLARFYRPSMITNNSI